MGNSLLLEVSPVHPHNLIMVVIPAIWRRSGQGFDSPHLHPSACRLRVFGWGCTGFDRAGKGAQATREATDVIRANP